MAINHHMCHTQNAFYMWFKKTWDQELPQTRCQVFSMKQTADANQYNWPQLEFQLRLNGYFSSKQNA